MGYRQYLIRIVTFLGGIYFFLEFVLPETVGGVRIDAYHDQISTGFITVGAMAVGLGLINLFLVHGSRIVFKRKGWPFSTALLMGLIAMMGVTGYDWYATARIANEAERFLVLAAFAQRIEQDIVDNTPDVPSAAERNEALRRAVLQELNRAQIDGAAVDGTPMDLAAIMDSLEKLDEIVIDNPTQPLPIYNTLSSQLKGVALFRRQMLSEQYERSLGRATYRVLFEGLFVSLGAAMFSLLGFYIAAAAYRAFRIRSAESALMMLAALTVMLGQIPFGVHLWEGFPDIRRWLLSEPNAAAFRAIVIGASVAGLVMAIRMWFSLESQSFTEKKKQ